MLAQKFSWKDKLIGQQNMVNKETEEDDDIKVLEWEIQTATINGTLAINFSDRIFQILVKHKDNAVVIKLLGRSIGFSVLQRKIYSLWKPTSSFHLMDIRNGYFLVNFQNRFDCEKVLSEGSWIVFEQYLTVQPWTLSFNPAQNFSSSVMSWIRLPRLPSYFSRRKILKEIGSLMGKVAKLDMNTDSKARGRFARMAVYVNLDKPLISQIFNQWENSKN